MGLFDAITGGAAYVTVEFPLSAYLPGQRFKALVRITSSEGPVNSDGAFLDILARETGSVRAHVNCMSCHHSSYTTANFAETTFEVAIPLSQPFTLAPGATQVFEGWFDIPFGVPPTYRGVHTQHEWLARGRLSAFGNDPDSGYHPFRVGVPP